MTESASTAGFFFPSVDIGLSHSHHASPSLPSFLPSLPTALSIPFLYPGFQPSAGNALKNCRLFLLFLPLLIPGFVFSPFIYTSFQIILFIR
ncbi:hypothetical protein BDW62DRAFT_177852 [Aspergillus aurantiobrunneus]